jgi:acyl phosphate:glycerol-3-phosphate acyltransferase
MTPTFLQLVLVSAFGYALGSIPFGLILTRIAGLGDIRDVGSGNIGATNVLRTGNKGIAAATLLLDGLKGTIAVIFTAALTQPTLLPLIAGLAAFIGHCFPVWLKFKGGKGVAVFFGVTFAWAWPVAILTALTWAAVAFLTRYSSLAALVAVVVSPLYYIFLGRSDVAAMAALLAVLVFWRHKENIDRLIKGEESKIGGSSKE